jgi:hypothetical protein
LERRVIHVASEQVLAVLVRRHVFDTERPFSSVLEGIFGGISQPRPSARRFRWARTHPAREAVCLEPPRSLTTTVTIA